MEHISLSKDIKSSQARILRENLTAGNALCGEFLHHCSKIALWMSKLLHDLKAAKKEIFVGKKFSAVTELVKENPKAFHDGIRLKALLKEFKTYTDMRTTMAHAHLTIGSNKDGSIVYLFMMPAYNELGHELKSTALEHQSFRRINSDLASLSNQIKQQKVSDNLRD